MAIPDYQTIMLPLLRLAGRGAEHSTQDAVETIIEEFGLSGAEREQILPGGTKTVISNRVQWAKTYLTQARLLEPSKRAHFRITSRGKAVLEDAPAKIDNKFLGQFAEFKVFLTRQRQPT
jgi:restriction system protein